MVVNGVRNGRKIKPPVTAIIQARMQSKRLPRKSLMDLGGRPLLSHVIERARAIEGVDRVVVATCDGEENLGIIELAREMNTGVFVGSHDDVLERYCFAAREFGGDYIVRVTGDNPFTDPEYASMAVEIALEARTDLCVIPNLPLGAAVEVIKREALEEACRHGEKPYHREHVTPYIKEHPELFHIEKPAVSFKNPYPEMRLTVDTPEDYEFAQALYRELYRGEIFSLSDVVEYLKKNPGLMDINKQVEQRTMRHSES
ncbi:MAG TPA: acylneuraminate cytidylyltransferase [Spirochaetes bacterium]|nr:acylneuraminate cytidylyltransferase [Spirochaetota bacterium]